MTIRAYRYTNADTEAIAGMESAMDAIKTRLARDLDRALGEAILKANGGVMPTEEEVRRRGKCVSYWDDSRTEYFWDGEPILTFDPFRMSRSDEVMRTQAMNEPLPCPFCGSKAKP